MALTNCPSCDRKVKPGTDECECGLILSKWEAKMKAAAESPVIVGGGEDSSSKSQAARWSSVTLALIVIVLFSSWKVWDLMSVSDADKMEELYAKYHEAVMDSDTEAMSELLTEARADAMKSPRAAARIERWKAATPKAYNMVRTEVKEDRAAARMRSSHEGKRIKGIVRFRKEEGAWKIDNVYWGIKAAAAPGRPDAAPEPAGAWKEEVGGEVRADDPIRTRTVSELLRRLQKGEKKIPPFNELLRRGEKGAAAELLQRMVRDRSLAVGGEPKEQFKTFLRTLGASINNDYYIAGPNHPRGEGGITLKEWDLEIRDGDLFCSLRADVEERVISGLDPEDAGEGDFPTFARYEIVVTGGSSGKGVRSETDIPRESGIFEAKGVKLLSDLGPGEYTVNLYFHSQYRDGDGGGKIGNTTEQPLYVTVR